MKGIDKSDGTVTDLELAKSILIAYFQANELEFGYEAIEICSRIKNELEEQDYEYFLRNEDNHLFFGGPEGFSGYRIRELSLWLKEHKEHPSIYGYLYDLNSARKVFYEIDGELKYFILEEAD